MNIIKISLLGMSAVLVALIFKDTRKEYSGMIMIAAGILIFGFGISKMSLIFKSVLLIKDKLNVPNDYLWILIKIVGITYICEFSSDICKDAGFGTISNQIQIFGKLSILLVSMPVFMNLFDLVEKLM